MIFFEKMAVFGLHEIYCTDTIDRDCKFIKTLFSK